METDINIEISGEVVEVFREVREADTANVAVVAVDEVRVVVRTSFLSIAQLIKYTTTRIRLHQCTTSSR